MLQNRFFRQGSDMVHLSPLFSDYESRGLLRLQAFQVHRPAVVLFPVLVDDICLPDVLHLESRVVPQHIPLGNHYVFGLRQQAQVDFLSLALLRRYLDVFSLGFDLG